MPGRTRPVPGLFDVGPAAATSVTAAVRAAPALAFPQDTLASPPSLWNGKRRVLLREDPPGVWFIVDQLSLYRLGGSPEVMTAQMRT